MPRDRARGAAGPSSARAAAPRDEADLIAGARALEGHSLAEIAAVLGVTLRGGAHAKGRTGELLERALGATGGAAAVPDFPALGVELKTVPVDRRGRARESTYVCTLPLAGADRAEWATSWARRKLACVLWVPIVPGAPGEPRGVAAGGTRISGGGELEGAGCPGSSRVGRAVLWRPTPAQEAVLAADFDEIVGLVGAGNVEALDARVGRWLQARPKAAHGRVRTAAFGPDDEHIAALPRGFYLRARFTAAILRDPEAVPP